MIWNHDMSAAGCGSKGDSRMTERNPIYRMMLRTGLVERAAEEFSKMPSAKVLLDAKAAEHLTISGLLQRRAITVDEARHLRGRVARAFNAQAIRHLRANTSLTERRKLMEAVKTAHSLGLRA